MNDNTPIITTTDLSASLNEDSVVNTSIIFLQAEDIDIGANAELTFSIINQGIVFGDTSGTPFAILTNGDIGEIILADPLAIDFETQRNFTVAVRVEDSGSSVLFSDVTVLIEILDVDDFLPEFPQEMYSITVPETSEINDFILTVKAFDRDTVDVSFSHRIRDYTADSFFSINSITGEIFLQRELNHEETPVHLIVVEVLDAPSSNAVTDTANVTIYVSDVNDLAPFFLPIPPVSVDEGNYSDYILTTLTVVDFDVQHNAEEVVFRVLTEAARFSISNRTDPSNSSLTYGDLILNGNIDFESQTIIVVTIQVFDQADLSTAQTAIATVFINVGNLDDEAPVFEQAFYEATVSELAAVDTSVIAVQADDPDVGVVLRYFLLERIFPPAIGPFKVNINSGLTQVSDTTLDFETFKYYTIKVMFFL